MKAYMPSVFEPKLTVYKQTVAYYGYAEIAQ